ncbi:hypothetical protein [Diaphorobacter caeni]|uniref:hypothetical protein n=1 Tax=Diaphorobacter caeni TaxID=2784387 RepID=UPI00188FFFC0|nr:hypothetical protein [Diaphorobacter caeni]MBF5005582.1 hypothetical protein [Diaphorobacter caeni]
MSGDRPIHLDLGMPSGSRYDVGHQGTDQQAQPEQRNATQLADDAAALRTLLDARSAPGQSGLGTPAQPPQASSPFALFGQGATCEASTSTSTGTSTHEALAGLDQTLSQMAQRLLVGDGSSGRRGVQIQLSKDSLPGVVMDVFEDAGAVVAEFTCSLEASRERLKKSAQWLADGLSQALQRPTCVRVQTDDPEDRCATQVQAGH